jgi:hypothetical protein
MVTRKNNAYPKQVKKKKHVLDSLSKPLLRWKGLMVKMKLDKLKRD